MSLRSLQRKLILRSRGLFDVEKWVACASQLNIVSVSSNFPMSAGHDANFVWNQDEVPQNSRYVKRFCYSSKLIAQTVATLLWFHTLIC